MRLFFQDFWHKKSKRIPFLRGVLFLISLLYKYGLSLWELSFRFKRLNMAPCPVVSVGNLTIGGQGKTPLVMKIASLFKESGFRVAIITRGYGRKKRGIFLVDPKIHLAQECGDEALLLAKNLRCPVIVGKDRIKAIKKAVFECGADIAILDDGFQVRGLKKDVEIVVFKTNMENFDLFPLGPMREPFDRIARSDIVILNGKVKGPYKLPKHLFDSKPVFNSSLKALNLCNIKNKTYIDYRYLKGKEVVAFSGLADNDSFFELLMSIGAKIKSAISFPDHYNYKPKDIKRILRNHADIYVTTEKDAQKLEAQEIPDNFYYLTVEMAIEEEKEFFSTILALIEKKFSGELPWKRGSLSSTQL
ncbi:MAG: tetraacyldisaccharide 4'-kinase [Desulfobacterota bacterium]|nr:tetraacyldisaccharide 4'-kinase [Thermodesulfobacteriota bacterium]MDW8001460.1 tetraacyldisaccharide 4'-kinase [Deltaproteobacteria bacterium]